MRKLEREGERKTGNATSCGPTLSNIRMGITLMKIIQNWELCVGGTEACKEERQVIVITGGSDALVINTMASLLIRG